MNKTIPLSHLHKIFYRLQVFGARCGFYAQASRAAEAAAGLATQPWDRAVSLYLARVYAMWAAVIACAQEEACSAEIGSAFAALKAELPLLQQAVAGTALEVQWGSGNGPIHLMQAMILARIDDSALWDANMAVVLANEAALGGAFTPYIRVLRLEDMYRRGSCHIFLEAPAIFNDEKQSLAIKAWARLILARMYHVQDSADRAFEEYLRIQPVPDAHMVAAVAKVEGQEILNQAADARGL